MKPFNLKRIIGIIVNLTTFVLLGAGAELAAQVEIKYPSRAPANGTFSCVGDTILVTVTADDLTVPTGTHWSGDTYVQKEGGKITKRFFTYHPYLAADPTGLTSREFEFKATTNGTTQTYKTTIAAKSCPPKTMNTSKVSVSSFGDKYNLGNVNFDYAFENQTSNEQHVRLVSAINPAQPFCPLGKNGTHMSRSNLNQVNVSYQAIQISDADYTIEAYYNEGDSLNRKTVIKLGSFNLTEELGTLQPDAAGYCPGNDIVFSLTLTTNWQNVLNQNIDNNESKIGSCFDWSGSPSPVSFTRREGNKYFFSTTASGTSTADFRCKMSVLIKYANARTNPKIDTAFTAIYDVPIVQPTYHEAKGFTQHEISICQGDPLNPSLTQLIDPGATVSEYRDGDNKKIQSPGYYIPSKSEVVSAIISSPCAWTDKLQINVIDKSEIQTFSIQHDTLICAGEALSFSATANSPITWTIMSVNNAAANDSWQDTENGKVHTRTFSDNAMVQAGVSQCGTDFKMFNVQVVQWPDVKINAETRGCPYTEVSLSGSGGSNPEYKLYDLQNNKDITNDMRAYITAAGLTGYPLRPNDNLELTYTARNQANGNTANTRPTSLSCPKSAKANIIAYPLPPIRISYDGTAYTDGGTVCVPREAAFSLTASGANTYQWLDTKPTPTAGTNQTLELAKDSLIRVRGVENTHQCFDTLNLRCVVSVEKAGRVKSAEKCPGTEVCFEADELPSTTYAWYGPDDKPLGINTFKLCREFSKGQDGVYTLKTQRFGCSESLPYTLTLYPAPNIECTGNSPLCVGEELVINYRTGLPDEGLQVSFTKDGESKSNEIEHLNGDLLRYRVPDAQPSDAGQYILTVTTTEHQCKDSDTYDFSVEIPAVVRIALDADAACEGAAGRLTAEVTPPSDIYTYKWSIDSRPVGGDSPDISLNWERNDNAIHLVVEQSACTSTADTVVTIIPVPHLSDMPKDTGVCQGFPICLSPTADIVPQEIIWYFINTNGKISQTPLPSLQFCQDNADESMNGRYYVEVANLSGSKRCARVSDTTRLTVYPTPDLRIDGPTFICDGSTVTLTAVSRADGTFRWHHNNETSATVSVTTAGQYEVTRTSTYGCQNTVSTTLEARPTPYFSLPPDTSICRGTSFLIYGPDDMDAYHWNDGSQGKDILAENGGWYILTVYRNECPYSDSLYVQQTFCGQFHFPTAFTPNDNRVNDTWGAISAAKDEDMAEYDLMVFDRNGKKVFHGKRISDQWDGRYKGELCPPGVYMYSFKALEKLEGIKYQASGTVTIVQ